MGHYDNCRPENCGVCGQLKGYCEHTRRKSKVVKTKKTATKKVVKKVVKETGPKAGDTVSMAFHYAGLVSWESCALDKVAKGKEVVWIDNQLYERALDGTYVYEDYTLGPCKKVLHFDGGTQAKQYQEENE